jgi:hypothetical protein
VAKRDASPGAVRFSSPGFPSKASPWSVFRYF